MSIIYRKTEKKAKTTNKKKKKNKPTEELKNKTLSY